MKRTGVILSSVVLSLAVALCLPVHVDAQSAANSGQIAGEVLDQSGALVADVEVTARNKDTNYTRAGSTDAAGRYAIGPVPIGTYEVTVRRANMEPETQEVYVSLGGRAAADFHLGITPVRESVDVTARAEPAQTFSKAVLTDLQLRNLPIPGRRIKTLFLQTPATQIEPECGGFSISGQKGVYTSFNVDGGDYTSSHFCGHVEMTPTFTTEALEEFQVLRSTFSAEFGRSTGGIINLATKSGSNQFHGSGFYLFRDDQLTKVDPFNHEQIKLGQQFGGSIGGPIATDRTFLFSATEIQDNRKPVQVLYSQLDLLGLRNTAGAQALIGVAPENQLTAVSQAQSFVNRLDHRLTNNNSLLVRVDFTRSKITDVVGSFINTNGLGADSTTNRDVQNASPTNNRTNVTTMVQLTSVVSPRRVNELRVELAREFRPWDPGTGPEVTVRQAGQAIAIYGPQATGLSYGNVGYKFTDTRYQFIDNFSIVTGAHTMKLGVDANLVNTSVVFNPGDNGIYRFDSLNDYLARRPALYQQFAGSGSVATHKYQFAGYFQDEWRALPGLTISPGFRYDLALLPKYAPATAPASRFPLATEIPNDTRMLGPRLGVAWDVHQDAKTVVRGAAGLFYAPPYISLFEQAIVSNGGNPDLSSTVALNSTADILNAFQSQGVALNSSTPLNQLPVLTMAQLNALSAPGGRFNNGTVFFIDPDFQLPRALHLRAAVEHQIVSGVTASVDYTQIAVSHMDRVRNLNLVPPVPDASGRPVYVNLSQTANAALRPFPQYAFAYVTESTARSLYRGMTTSLSVHRPRFTADAFYTLGFSKSDDDHENGGFSSANYVDAYNLQNEYNWSNIDQRHQFAVNGVFFLPKGLEASTAMRFNSGRPFSARTGVDSNTDGIVNDRPLLDGEVVRRNTFRNRGFADTSVRAQKNFVLPNEKGTIAVFVDVYNLFNLANVETTQTTYGPSLNAAPTNALFGQIQNPDGSYIAGSTLRTTPFQVQLGLRFQF